MVTISDMVRDGEVQPWNLIEQGELLRWLGRFDEAVAILKVVSPDGRSEVRAVRWRNLHEAAMRKWQIFA
jgi:hypothetical protein